MAHTKSGGSTKGNRDSVAKRLGVKIYGGQPATPGNIIVRQKGSRMHPGKGTDMGKDYTIFSVAKGVVSFRTRNGKKLVEVV